MPFPEHLGRSFDEELSKSWMSASKAGATNYSPNLLFKCMPGRFGISCQLNTERAALRRKPHPHRSLHDDFDQRRFNFTKITTKEYLLELLDTEREKVSDDERDFLIVNASPIEKGHAILLPAPKKCFQQRLTEYGLRLATITGESEIHPVKPLIDFSCLKHYSVDIPGL